MLIDFGLLKSCNKFLFCENAINEMQWNINYHIFANFPPGLFFKKYFCLGIIKGKASLAVNKYQRGLFFEKHIPPGS